MKQKLILFFISISVAAGVFFRPADLKAQINCTGTACGILPYSQKQFDQLIFDINYQYMDSLMADMGKASIMANSSGVPIGTVNLHSFTIGGSASSGYVEKRDIVVQSATAGSMTLPSAGVSVIPRAFIGVNLGALMGMSYDPFEDPGKPPVWYSPGRFDIYLSGIDYSYRKDNDVEYNYLNGNPTFKSLLVANSIYSGADVYYHLIEGKEFGNLGPLFRFLGLSIGGGAHRVNQKVQYFNPDSKSVFNAGAGSQVVWNGNDLITYRMKLSTTSAEVKTGFQLFYFLNITGAYGSSANNGYQHLQLSRFGRAYVSTDLNAALGITVPDAWISMTLQNKKSVPHNSVYRKVGVEINLSKLKLTAEGIMMDGERGANVGVRFEM